MKRTVTGLSLISVLFVLMILTRWSQTIFDLVILLAAGVAAVEMYFAVAQRGVRPHILPLAVVWVVMYPMIRLFGGAGFLTVAGVGFTLAFACFIFKRGNDIRDFLYTLFLLIYPVLLMGLALLMTTLYGMIPFLLGIAAAMMSDTLAYYLGSLIKGKKIFPTISPKKTYAGAIAGLFGGALGAILVYLIFELGNVPVNDAVRFEWLVDAPVLFYLLLGLGIAVVSELGDLAASRVKRELGIKDFSRLLGSHGGLMDRLDSILFANLFMAIVMAFFGGVV